MTRDPKPHNLKCWPVPFAAIAKGIKTYEIRKNDRDFEVGDILILREWVPEDEKLWAHYTGKSVVRVINYITVTTQ